MNPLFRIDFSISDSLKIVRKSVLINPLFRIDFSISDSLKIVRKSVLIYETIIEYHNF